MEDDHRVVGGLPKMGDRNDIFNRLYHLEISLYPSSDFTLPSEKVKVNNLDHVLDCKVNTGSAAKAWWRVSSGPLLHELSFFFPFIFISWRLITLQYCSGFCHTLTWISHAWIYTCSPSWSPLPPPSPPDPSGSSQCTRSEHLSHASNLGCWSVSPLIIYMFRLCSL